MSLAEGLYTGMLLESPDVQIQEMLLGPIDAVRDAWYLSSVDGGWLPWADADPVLVSEVRRSLDALAEMRFCQGDGVTVLVSAFSVIVSAG